MNIINLFIPPAHASDIMDQINAGQPTGWNIVPSAGNTIADILSGGGKFNLLSLAFLLIGFYFFFNIVGAGYDYLLSSGDPKKIAGASSRFMNGFMGLGIAFFAVLIVNIITSMLGLRGLF